MIFEMGAKTKGGLKDSLSTNLIKLDVLMQKKKGGDSTITYTD